MFYPSSLTLLDLNTGESPAPASTTMTWEVSCPQNDARANAIFAAASLMQSGGATDPTASLSFELSPDNVHWFISNPALATTTEDQVDNEFADDFIMVRFVRVTVTAAGGTRPAVRAFILVQSELPLTARLIS